MKRRVGQIIVLVVLTGIAILLAVAVSKNSELRIFRSTPAGIMGTECSIQVVAPLGEAGLARRALEAAEVQLRQVEIHMSVKLDSTEISHLNASPAGRPVPLTPGSLEVLDRRSPGLCGHGRGLRRDRQAVV